MPLTRRPVPELPPVYGAFAVKWMYSVDGGLVMPYDDRLASLMDTEDFRAIVDRDLWQRLKYIRQTGNAAAHTSRKIAPGAGPAVPGKPLVLHGLYRLLLRLNLQPGEFDPALLEQQTAAPALAPAPEVDLAALMAENEALRAELTARREAQQPSYTPSLWISPSTRPASCTLTPCSPTPAGPRGRTGSMRWSCPVCPTKSEVGYADYVLYDDAHRPLAVIEAKRTCVDPSKGRQQAQEYAKILERSMAAAR